MRKFRFHMLGLTHLPCSKEYMSCAFTQKNHKLSRMLLSLGHEVYYYGAEGSDLECTKFIQTHTLKDIRQAWGEGDNRFEIGYDWTNTDFKHDFNSERTEATKKFYRNAIAYISEHKKDDDFLLCTQGSYHTPIADAVKLFLTCEPGIGYRGSVQGRFRAFESSYIQNFTYGSEHPYESINGSFYDRVIPNYFDEDDVEYSNQKDDYYLFIGRMIKRKGILTAAKTCNILGKKLIIVGQGAHVDDRGYLVPTFEPDFELEPGTWEYFGYAGVEDRKKLMSKAIATFTPTEYLECLMPDEVILGCNKIISKIKVGDSVVQQDGSIGQVKMFIENQYEGDCVKINPRYLKELVITPEHPILIKKDTETEWVKASEVKDSDYLVLPKYKRELQTEVLNLSNYITTRCQKEHKDKLVNVTVDEDLMWIFGTYLAEGNINSSKNHGKYIKNRGLTFTFHTKEVDTLNRVRRVMKNKFGYSSNKSVRNDNSTQITFSAYPLANYFSAMFGSGARNKKIPQWIMDCPKNLLLSFLQGYIAGDGSYTQSVGHKTLSMRTSSLVLAMQIQLVATKFGVLLSLTHNKREGTGKGKYVNAHDIYDLRSRRKTVLNPQGISTENSKVIYKEDDDNFYIPIKTVGKHYYKGLVYNLHTTDNTYLASNFVVHNCFAGTHVESMLHGTPPITTNFAVFPETIPDYLNGKVGFRCNTLQDFVDAAIDAKDINPEIVREYGERFLMDNVKWEFEKWFQDLYNVYESTISDKKGWHRVQL